MIAVRANGVHLMTVTDHGNIFDRRQDKAPLLIIAVF